MSRDAMPESEGRTQRLFEGLSAIVKLRRNDGTAIDVDIENIRMDEEGQLIGDLDGVDQYAMEYAQEAGVALPEILEDGESPFATELADDTERSRKKIIVGGAIGSLVAGASIVGIHYAMKLKKKQ